MRTVAGMLAGLTVAAVAVGGAAPRWPGLLRARAHGSKALTAGDFHGYQHAASSFAINSDLAVVSGDRYGRAVVLHNCGYTPNGVSFNTRRFRGYRAISFTVGISDRANAGTRADFTATADGRPVYAASLQQGQIARRVTLAFGATEVLSFGAATRTRYACADIVLGNPVVVVDAPVAPQAPPATGPRPLTAPDFYGYQRPMSFFAAGDGAAAVAGDRYARAVVIHNCGYTANGVSINAHRLRGYRAVRFDVGLADGDDVTVHADFAVTADGAAVYRRSLQQGRLAERATIPFGRAEVLGFGALTTTRYACSDVLIGNPVAIP